MPRVLCTGSMARPKPTPSPTKILPNINQPYDDALYSSPIPASGLIGTATCLESEAHAACVVAVAVLVVLVVEVLQLVLEPVLLLLLLALLASRNRQSSGDRQRNVGTGDEADGGHCERAAPAELVGDERGEQRADDREEIQRAHYESNPF